MSRWLRNVGQLLDQLDDKAEQIVVETAVGATEDAYDDDETFKKASTAVRERLSSSQLSLLILENGEGDYKRVEETSSAKKHSDETVKNESLRLVDPEVVHSNEDAARLEDKAEIEIVETISAPQRASLAVDEENVKRSKSQYRTDSGLETPVRNASLDTTPFPLETPFTTPAQGSPLPNASSVKSTQNLDECENGMKQELQKFKDLLNNAIKEKEVAVAEANKEARTLRRHMVALNEQLNVADKEIEAQRKELEDVAVRVEEDRRKRKEQSEQEKLRHAQEIEQMRQKYDRAQTEMKEKSEIREEEIRKQLAEAQDLLRHTGGERRKELYEVATREQGLQETISVLEDEKETFLSHISMLQTQQEVIASRLESLSNTAENALAREREAEERLDEALSLHARQISQRQARESELEKTIADLSAALVEEQSRTNEKCTTKMENNDGSLSPENELLLAQLEQERQSNEVLRKEMHRTSEECKKEVILAHTRQDHFDRELLDLTQYIERLKAELQEKEHESSKRDISELADPKEDRKRLQQLTEEMMRQREKLCDCNSEIATLRLRLQDALTRATVAEAAAESTHTTNFGTDIQRSLKMRKKGRSKAFGPSMRSVMGLHVGNDEATHSVGQSLDSLDSFLLKTGNVLRYNALARLLFVLYLLLLHLWTFALIFFHAHSIESMNGGTLALHDPASLMHESISVQSPPLQDKESTGRGN